MYFTGCALFFRCKGTNISRPSQYLNFMNFWTLLVKIMFSIPKNGDVFDKSYLCL